MSRLTYKLDEPIKSTYATYKYMRISDYDVKRDNYGRISDAMIYNKLGEIEDLLDNYNIDLDELESFLANYDYDFYDESSEVVEQVIVDNKKYIDIDFFGTIYKETQALKERWQKLREWVENNCEVLLYSINDKPAKLGNKRYNYFERKQLLDKMQELEKEN